MLNGESACKRSRSEGTGSSAPQGPRGITGERGETGTQGPQGATGLKGEQGVQGERGSDGSEGAPGTDGVSMLSYSTENLPPNTPNGTIAFDTTLNLPVYFNTGKWYNLNDGSEIIDKTIDIYLIAGQSNAHGYSQVQYLTDEQKTQDGLFYTSWHTNNTNASDTQNFSEWATSLVAGQTTGGTTTRFGPELGFVERSHNNNLTVGQPLGVIKYGVGSSTLWDRGDNWSDWDLTAVGYRRGDALRGFKLAIADAITKLTAQNYTFRIAGMVWWQGESEGQLATEGMTHLTDLIAHIRTYLKTTYPLYVDMPKENFPIVITGTTNWWGARFNEVANADNYIGFVNSQIVVAPTGATKTALHPGSNDTYAAAQEDIDAGIATTIGQRLGGQDFNNDGINDMITMGEVFSDQMKLAKLGQAYAASGGFTPLDVPNLSMWYDADDVNSILWALTTTPQIGETYLANISHTNPAHSMTIGDIVTIQSVGGMYYTSHGDFTLSWFEAGHLTLQGDSLARELVSQINDKSGNNNHAAQTVYEQQPEYSMGTLNNRGEIKSLFHTGQIGLDIVPPIEVKEIYMVAYYKDGITDSFVDYNTLMSGSGSSGGPRVMGNTQTSSWITNEIFNDETFVNAQIVSSNVILPMPTSIIRFKSDTAKSTLESLLYFRGSNDRGWDGGFGEFVALSADASTEDREKIEGYLAHKWSLISSLPSNHTYKTSPP